MLKIHIDGEGVCGTYSYDIAQTKVQSSHRPFARQNDQPLMCCIARVKLEVFVYIILKFSE